MIESFIRSDSDQVLVPSALMTSKSAVTPEEELLGHQSEII